MEIALRSPCAIFEGIVRAWKAAARVWPDESVAARPLAAAEGQHEEEEQGERGKPHVLATRSSHALS
jgi:hypothetical protein